MIAFVRARAIWVMRSGGSGLRQVTWPRSPKYADRDPSWSPDGRIIYFSRATDAGSGETASIYSIGVDGRGVRRITYAAQDSGLNAEAACHEEPSVSANGKIVVYLLIRSCAHGLGSEIAAATSAGKPQKLGFRLASPADVLEPEYVKPTWSPTSMKIAYGISDYDCKTMQYWVYSSSTDAAPRQIVSLKTSISCREGGVPPPQPAWSPDGNWITFLQPTTEIMVRPFVPYQPYEDYSRGDVWLVRDDGTGLRQLTTTGNFIASAWLPS
jgi:Tol biopolymer transport system component